jgi:Uncharacterised nucleotidyltransferase
VLGVASLSSREFSLLCLLIRDPACERIELMDRHSFDWSILAQLAERHGVRPQLIRGLSRTHFVDVPAKIKQCLDDFHRFHLFRCLHVGAELFTIADLLEARNVRYATFKGAALATSLYGNISGREFNDIDLLVHEDDLEPAEACLRSRGYCARSGDMRFRSAFMAYQNQYIFETDQMMVDLHWDFNVTRVPFPLGADEIWDNLDSVSIDGRNIPTLGRHELALYLAGHGAKHGWCSLSLVCDFAKFVRAHPELDWMRLWQRSAQKKCGNLILLACALAARLLDASVDKEVLTRGERTPGVRDLAHSTIEQLMGPPTVVPPGLEEFFGGMSLCETWAQKAGVIWGLVSTRTTGDYEAMPLPRPLWRFYHLTRPFRLAIRVLTSVRTRS